MISNKPSLTAQIFDIQGHSVHDGPGCRTLIFMSGCTLNCYWCSNPEGISRNPGLMYFQSKCILCGNCEKNCPYGAIRLAEDRILISREKCAACTEKSCVNECYTNALKISGYEISVRDLAGIIDRDRKYWGAGGGVTLTGGEPLLQIDFVEALLKTCYDTYIHTAIETCGNVPWKNFSRALPYLDWIFYDLKNVDGREHFTATGADNALILENARKLASEFTGRLIFRLPLVPGFNDSDQSIRNTISFLRETGQNEINILPLHHLGKEKYAMLDKEYLASTTPSADDELKKLSQLFLDAGISCYLGSETPF